MIGCWDTIQSAAKYPDFEFSSLQHLELILVFDRYKAGMVAFLAGAVGCQFVQDMKSRRLRGILVRCTLTEYMNALKVMVAVGCIGITCLGFVLYCCMLLPLMGIRIPLSSTIIAKPFLSLAQSRFCIVYLLGIGVNFGLSAVIPVVIGMWISVYSQSGYIAVGGAVVVFYMLYSFSLRLPPSICYSDMSSGLHVPDGAGIPVILIWHAVYWTITIAVVWKGFLFAVRRRYNDGTLL